MCLGKVEKWQDNFMDNDIHMVDDDRLLVYPRIKWGLRDSFTVNGAQLLSQSPVWYFFVWVSFQSRGWDKCM